MEYIYFRIHPSYIFSDVYKLGKTNDLLKEDLMYEDEEIIKGRFILVIETLVKNNVKKFIQQYFKHINVYHENETEYFKSIIVTQLKRVLNDEQIQFKKISSEEIKQLLENRLYTIKE